MASSEDVIKLLSEDDYLHDPIQFDIDNDLRIVTIPKDGNIIGVVGDKNTNRVNFRMPRYYNGFDMSEFQVRVNYKNVNQKTSYYEVNDLTTAVKTETADEDKLLFTWLVDSDVCEAQGNVNFSVRMLKTADDGTIIQEFNTTIATGFVLEGLDAYVSGIKNNVDLLNRLRADVYVDVLNKIGGIGGGGSGTAIPLISTFEKLEDTIELKTHDINISYEGSLYGDSDDSDTLFYNAANEIMSQLFSRIFEILSTKGWNRTYSNNVELTNETKNMYFRDCYFSDVSSNVGLVVEIRGTAFSDIRNGSIYRTKLSVTMYLTSKPSATSNNILYEIFSQINIALPAEINPVMVNYDSDNNTYDGYKQTGSVNGQIIMLHTNNVMLYFNSEIVSNTKPLNITRTNWFGVIKINNTQYYISPYPMSSGNMYIKVLMPDITIASSNQIKTYLSTMFLTEYSSCTTEEMDGKYLIMPTYICKIQSDKGVVFISNDASYDILCTEKVTDATGYKYKINDKYYVALSNNVFLKLQEV